MFPCPVTTAAFIRVLSGGYLPGLAIIHYPVIGYLWPTVIFKAIRLLSGIAFNHATYQYG